MANLTRVRSSGIQDNTIEEIDLDNNIVSTLKLKTDNVALENDVLKVNSLGNLYWAPSSVSLSDLSDVDVSLAQPGYVLKYNGISWIAAENTGAGGGIPEAPVNGVPYLRKDGSWQSVSTVVSLDDLSDVEITSVADGEVLKFNGSNWVPAVQVGITRVYDNIGLRPATGNLGDQAMVLDNGNGRWCLYLWTPTGWFQIATQESSTVDARTLFVDIDYNDASPISLGIITDLRRVTLSSVTVNTAFNDPNASITIGTLAVPNLLMNATHSDLTLINTFSTSSDYVFDQGIDTEVFVFLNSATSTQGNVRVSISYS